MKQLNAQDAANAPSSASTSITKGNVLTGLKAQFSRQQRSSISKKIGQNPFEAIAMMFKDVPLITINTKDINVKIPALTSDDINNYYSYGKSWLVKNGKILEDWTKEINQLLAFCGTTNKADAQKMKDQLTAQLPKITDNTIKKLLQSEINDMDNIIKLPENTTRQQLGSDVKNIGINAANTTKKVTTLPARQSIQAYLTAKKKQEGAKFQDQNLLDVANQQLLMIGKCSGII